MESNQSAARAARRFLVDRVRDDWEWPNTPEHWSASDEEVRGVTDFRTRYYGTSSPSETESEAAAAAPADPYKFDSPDSIGAAIESKAESRKRKRRAAMESEMAWNEGLAQFVHRRDAWTGVASVRKYGTDRRDTHDAPATNGEPPSADSQLPPEVQQTSGQEPTPPPAEAVGQDPLVPLAKPLLPGNPIRNSITPKSYSDIYNKIVVTSRTPSVPINLGDMTKALVQGWKDNGEWPPKAGPLDPLVGRKRAALLGVRIDAHGEGLLSHHPHMKKGVDSVKRIFHLSSHAGSDHGVLGNNG